jgi:hypothetical protein
LLLLDPLLAPWYPNWFETLMRLLELHTALARIRLTRPLTLRQESVGSSLAVLVPGTACMCAEWSSTESTGRELATVFERMAADVRSMD